MLSQVVDALGSELGKSSVRRISSPALMFWAVGLVLWFLTHDWRLIQAWLTSQPDLFWIVIALLIASLIAITSTVFERLATPCTRFLEGYWPSSLRPVKRVCISIQSSRASRIEVAYQGMAKRVYEAGTDDAARADKEEVVALEQKLARYPSSSDVYMPTTLGNVLRSSERKPLEKYGLDSIHCFPRLWLLLPDGPKRDIGEARQSLNLTAQYCLCSVGLLTWTVWTYWAVPLAVAGACASYLAMIRSAQVFGTLVESVFDVYRMSLYTAARWSLPENAAQERLAGEALTAYFARGSDSVEPKFT